MENMSDFLITIYDSGDTLTTHFSTNPKTVNDRDDVKNDIADIKISRYLRRAEEDGGITLTGLHGLAKSVGIINPEKATRKIELIRNIQKAANQSPCFRSETSRLCSDTICHWRTECRKMVAVWHR